MKYFCMGEPIELVKLSPSPRFIDNLPLIGIPLYGKLPVTKTDINNAFNRSDQFILCKNMEDAKSIRAMKVEPPCVNTTPDFTKGAIKGGYPFNDFGIYEIETDTTITFSKLNQIHIDELGNILSQYVSSLILFDASKLPATEICVINKKDLNPKLIASHYFNLDDGTDLEEKKEKSFFKGKK